MRWVRCPGSRGKRRRRRGKRRFFAAALEARAGELWPADADYGTPAKPRRATQRRHIERGALLLGLHPSQPERLAELLRSELGLMGLDHVGARKQFAAAHTLSVRGKVVVGVLERLAVDAVTWVRVAMAGHRAGLWGSPAMWSPRLGRVVFPTGGTAPWLAARPPPE